MEAASVPAARPETRSRRTPPSLKLGIAAFVAYAFTFVVVDLIFGVDYDTLVDSADNALKGILIPVVIACLVAALICTRWGWWGPVMRERRILPGWTLIVPALMATAVIGGLIGADWDRDTDLVLIVVIGTLFVGFGEEIASRGLLLIGARGERSEVQVWLITSVLFGLLHGLNIILGQAVDLTIKQIIFAFLFGSALYVVRRSTGLLVAGMLLHALWDMSTFLNTSPVEAVDRVPAGASFQGIVSWVVLIATAVVLATMFSKNGRERGLAESPDPA